MKNKLVFIILLFFACTCFAADVVMFIGGTGDQTGNPTYGPYYPGVVTKAAWEAGSVSDFVNTNGAPMVTLSGSVAIGTPSGGTCYITGDCSNATVGTYAYVHGAASAPDGYYLVETIDGTSGCYISETNLDGTTITSDDTADFVLIGGAGTSITVADSRITADFGATLLHNVWIYDNKDESFGDITLASASTPVYKIYWVGKKQGSGVDFDDCETAEDYPVITGTGTIKISGNGWDVSNISQNRSIANDYGFYLTGKETRVHHCYLIGNGRSIISGSGVFDNNIIVHVGTSTGQTYYYALGLSEGVHCTNNLILTDTAMGAVYCDSVYSGTVFKNNIVINYGGTPVAIVVIGAANNYVTTISDNINI